MDTTFNTNVLFDRLRSLSRATISFVLFKHRFGIFAEDILLRTSTISFEFSSLKSKIVSFSAGSSPGLTIK